MDSQGSDSADQVDDRKTWTDAVLASLRASDHHVRDEEIFEILGAGRDGEAAAELFAAKGVTLPMYCVWKAKYRHLNLEELRAARRGELWRARLLLGALCAAVLLAAGGAVVGLARAADVSSTEEAASTPIRPPSLLMPPESATPAQMRVRSTPAATESAPERGEAALESGQSLDAGPDAALAPGPEPETRSIDDRAQPGGPPATTETGYRIQVAAAPTLQEGRVLVERLMAAGYPAYLVPATVGGAEVFRVRIGPFDSLSAAEEVASYVRRDGFAGAWIAR